MVCCVVVVMIGGVVELQISWNDFVSVLAIGGCTLFQQFCVIVILLFFLIAFVALDLEELFCVSSFRFGEGR